MHIHLRQRVPILLLAVAAFALIAVACGGDDDDGTPTATGTADGTATGTATADGTGTATATGTATGSATGTATGTATATGTTEGSFGDGAEGTITVYSGRSESLIGPALEQFAEDTGIGIEVRYGNTPSMAAQIVEEGDNSPADVFISQDAGALGLLSDEGLFAELPDDILDRVPEAFRSQQGEWVGLSGRARVVAYNTEMLDEGDLPDSILEYTDPQWEGRIGWAPENASFQSFVTGLRVAHGDDEAREWLEGIMDNDPSVYPNNTSIVEAVANGEVEVGFVNHYYLFRFLEEQGEDFGARNYYFTNGDVGGLMNVAGAGIVASSEEMALAEELLSYLLSEQTQQYFATETFEFPLVEGVQPDHDVPELETLQPVDIDLSDLDDLQGTIEMLQEVGALP